MIRVTFLSKSSAVKLIVVTVRCSQALVQCGNGSVRSPPPARSGPWRLGLDLELFLGPPLTRSAPPPGGVIRVKGRNLTESEHIKLGAYHSLELEMGRAFTLQKVGRGRGSAAGKQQDRWFAPAVLYSVL